MNTDEINRRKTEHVRLALSDQSQMRQQPDGVDAGFDRWRYEPLALPEANLDQVEIRCDFLGKRLAFPFIVSSMTGGGKFGPLINPRLAEACQAQGVGLAVGSQRVALADASARDHFNLRRTMPDGLLIGNLGATQLLGDAGLDTARQAIDMLEADALYIHLNPLQESAQSGGDRDWRGVAAKIEALCKASPVPIIAKEVGHGIGPRTAKQLAELGVAAIDVAGAGGTSWCKIETMRHPDPKARAMLEPFASWGMPTVDALLAAKAVAPSMPLIASGGIRHGLDVAKAVSLGAVVAGSARAFLTAAMVSTEEVVDQIDIWRQQYRLARFLGGDLVRV